MAISTPERKLSNVFISIPPALPPATLEPAKGDEGDEAKHI